MAERYIEVYTALGTARGPRPSSHSSKADLPL
jgi:hypothetical protein